MPFTPSKSVTDQDIVQLKEQRTKNWDVVRNIDLSDCEKLTSLAMRHLPIQLNNLNISGTKVGIGYLRKYPLAVLNLSHTSITDESLMSLSSNLLVLDISNTKITEKGLFSLSGNFRELNLSKTAF